MLKFQRFSVRRINSKQQPTHNLYIAIATPRPPEPWTRCTTILRAVRITQISFCEFNLSQQMSPKASFCLLIKTKRAAVVQRQREDEAAQTTVRTPAVRDRNQMWREERLLHLICTTTNNNNNNLHGSQLVYSSTDLLNTQVDIIRLS